MRESDRNMYQRKKIDITLADLAQGLKFCAKAPPREQLLKEIEHLWSDGRAVLPTLSVRTGFDLLLKNLDLGDRDEIIITAVTIPHMEQIILEHGYTPVPIDFDPQDMQTSAALVERAIGPRTGALMITHLFGTRQPLDTWVDLAREHDLFLIEDCAQAFDGLGYAGDVNADISMFSFGSIKTATALGGALLSVRDYDLAERMRAEQATYPVQDRRVYMNKLVKYMGLVGISSPERFSMMIRALQLTGRDYDMVIRRLTRGFSGPGFWDKLRHQMSAPHVAMLHHRLMTYDNNLLERRAKAGRFFASLLDPHIVHFGWRCARHTHWLFPIAVSNPHEVIVALRAQGFDATSGSSTLVALENNSDHHELDTELSKRLMNNIVYLPISQHVPESEIARCARALNAIARPLEIPAPRHYQFRPASLPRLPEVIG